MSLALGVPHPRFLMQVLSSAEFAEWLAYYSLDPFGLERQDMGFGIMTSTLANIHRDTKKQPQPFRAQDFMPQFGAASKPTSSWKKQLAMVEMFNQAFGGKDIRQ